MSIRNTPLIANEVKEQIRTNNLEDRFNDAINEVIRERPADPFNGICTKFQSFITQQPLVTVAKVSRQHLPGKQPVFRAQLTAVKNGAQIDSAQFKQDSTQNIYEGCNIEEVDKQMNAVLKDFDGFAFNQAMTDREAIEQLLLQKQTALADSYGDEEADKLSDRLARMVTQLLSWSTMFQGATLSANIPSFCQKCQFPANDSILDASPVVELIRGGKALNSKLKLIRIGVSVEKSAMTADVLATKLIAKQGLEFGEEDDKQLASVLAKIEDKADLEQQLKEVAAEHALMWQEAVQSTFASIQTKAKEKGLGNVAGGACMSPVDDVAGALKLANDTVEAVTATMGDRLVGQLSLWIDAGTQEWQQEAKNGQDLEGSKNVVGNGELADQWIKTVGGMKVKSVINALKDEEGVMALLEKDTEKTCQWGSDADQREWNVQKGQLGPTAQDILANFTVKTEEEEKTLNPDVVQLNVSDFATVSGLMSAVSDLKQNGVCPLVKGPMKHPQMTGLLAGSGVSYWVGPGEIDCFESIVDYMTHETLDKINSLVNV